MDSFMKRFLSVQTELKAPKGRMNKFGGYKYRSCEDILKAAKPLLKAKGLILTLTDEPQQRGDRYYIVATAKVWDTESDNTLSASACAREAEDKKGMDDSQITGTSSSYARKYALNGLFCLDDVQDADMDFDLSEGPRCAKCGNPIKPYRAAMPGGTNYTAASIAKMTKQKYGSELCWSCASKLKGEN